MKFTEIHGCRYMEKCDFSYLPSTEAPMRKDSLFTASTVIKTSLSSLYDSKTNNDSFETEILLRKSNFTFEGS